jgi:hypothetical protein
MKMKMIRTACWVIAIASIATASAFAQRGPMGGGMGMAPPVFRGTFNPTVGSGAVYQVEARGTKNDLEISVVGKEEVSGKSAYWLQMGMKAPQAGGQMYMKILMVVDGKNASASRMIMQMAGQQPMEMPMQGMMGNMQQNTATDVRDSADHVGAESVTTPAGMFNTEHYRAKDGSWDAWLSTQVAPWGVVKSITKDATMTVTRLISDAQDQITGTPQKIDPMGMMRGMGRGQ